MLLNRVVYVNLTNLYRYSIQHAGLNTQAHMSSLANCTQVVRMNVCAQGAVYSGARAVYHCCIIVIRLLGARDGITSGTSATGS